MTVQLVYSVSLAVVASFILILIWVWFWTRKQDINNRHTIAVFVGGAITLLPLLPFEKLVFVASGNYTSLITLILWAFSEEILKLSVVLCAIKFLKLDKAKIVIYMIITALGFAALENTLFVFNQFSTVAYLQGLLSISMRSLAATIMHFVTSGLLGMGLLKSMHAIDRRNKIMIFAFSVIATSILHALFNFFVLRQSYNVFLVAISTWVSAFVLIYIIFRKKRKMLIGQISFFILIIVFFLSGIVYASNKLPLYPPETLAAWQSTLKGVENSLASFKDVNSSSTESFLALNSIHNQLKSALITMEKNQNLSNEEKKFLESYNDLVNIYNNKLLLKSAREKLKDIEYIHTKHALLITTNSSYSKSLTALNSIHSRLKEVIQNMEENRSLSSDQKEFLGSYNAYINQFLCIFRKEKKGNLMENCNL